MKPLIVLLCVFTFVVSIYVVIKVLSYLDRRRTRQEAERKRPQVQALLDEMIDLVRGWQGPLSDLVFENSRRKDVDDSRTTTTRSISLYPDRHAPQDERRSYSLSVRTKPAKKGGENVAISLNVSRGEETLHLYYPDILAKDVPPESWMTERLNALFALIGDASGWREIEKKRGRLSARLDERSKNPSSN